MAKTLSCWMPRIAACLCALCAIAPGHALELAIGSARVPSPGVAAIPLHLIGKGASPAALAVRITYSAPLLRPLGVTPAPGAAGKSAGSFVKNDVINIIISGGTSPIEDGLLAELIFAVRPGLPAGQSLEIVGDSADAVTPGGMPIAVTITPGALRTEPRTGQHNADTARDWNLSLAELLRGIQLYNAHAFHCAPDTEDGYAPLPGDQNCATHQADYAPPDWRLSLSKLLRLIQFFNSPGGSYHPDPQGEDGFAPGPF